MHRACELKDQNHQTYKKTRTLHFSENIVLDPHECVPDAELLDVKQLTANLLVVLQRAPNPPEFAQPGLSRSNGSHPQQEGTNLGVFVPIWLVPLRREATNLGVCLICVISKYSNGAVQIRVGFELAECFSPVWWSMMFFSCPFCNPFLSVKFSLETFIAFSALELLFFTCI